MAEAANMCWRETEEAFQHGNGEEQLLEVIESLRITGLVREISPFLLAALYSLVFVQHLRGAELKVGSSLRLGLICASTATEVALEAL